MCSGTACHRLRGGNCGARLLRPACRRLYSKSAKYGVTHGSNRLPGLEKCSPLVIGSAVVGWLSLCCAVLAPDIVFRGDHVLPLLCYRGVPLAHNLSIYCRFRQAQLRKCPVVMIRHATLWLSDSAVGGASWCKLGGFGWGCRGLGREKSGTRR